MPLQGRPDRDRRAWIGEERSRLQQQLRRRTLATALVVLTVVVVCVVGILAASSSSSSSGTQQVVSTYVTYQGSGSNQVILYWVVLANGQTKQVPNKTVYAQLSKGGGYDPDSDTVLSPEEERAAQVPHSTTKVNAPGDEDPDVPVVHLAPPPPRTVTIPEEPEEK